MQEFERRERWLERAEKDTELAMARLVLSAEMWAEQRESGRALQVIEKLHADGARHIHGMRIALGAHLQSGHWEDALRIVRALDKHKGLPAPASEAYKVLAYRGLLHERGEDADALERTWNSIPAADRALPELALEAARCFNRLGRAASAAQILEQALQQNWNERLLAEYARCAELPATGALLRLERWMQTHGRSAAALCCAGRICLRAQLWGKARSYLEESRRVQDNPETSLAMAELAQSLGDEALAADCFRDAAIGLAQRQADAGAGRPRGLRREPSI
jgi:HemY protein